MANQCPQHESDEEEVFFGPISDKEARKARKFSRRTTAMFVPGFRDDRKLMRFTMVPHKLGVLSEDVAADHKENFPPHHVVIGESAGKPRVQRTPFALQRAVIIDYVNEASAAAALIDARNAAAEAVDVNIMNDSAADTAPADSHSDSLSTQENATCDALTEYHSRKEILRGLFKTTMASDVAIRQFDFSGDQNNAESSVLFTDEESVIDSSLKEDVTMAIKRLSNEGCQDESINSSMSSNGNGPKPELLADACVVPADVETPKAAKAVYDMSPLVKTLPALKVTTPVRLHDEHNSAFKMYGSQGELRVAKECDNVGGDSGIEDGGSESPSKISRASSCATTISPEVSEKVTETPVKKRTPRPQRKMDHGPRTPRQRSEDRTNSYIHSDERKAAGTPVKPSNNTSTPRSPRLTRSSRPSLRSHKVDPKEVTERLHSPAPRCCRHNHGVLNPDGRPGWNSSTLLDNSSCRGTYLSSKETPFASPFCFLTHTPGSTPRPTRKKTPCKDPVPKLDLDRLDSVPRKGTKGQAKIPPAAATPDLKKPSQKRARSPCSVHSNPANKRLPLKSSDVDNTTPKDHKLLSLNEHQLDAVTNLHTMCNGQQQAKFVTKPLATSVIKKAPEPKNPKIQWPSNPAIELDCPSPAGQNKAARPILHIRKPDEFFPYVGEPPSPVVVKKTSTRRNVNPLSSFSF